MQIIVHGQNMEVTPDLREYLQKKMTKLSRYFDQIADVQFHASAQRGFKTAEVTMNANGHLIRAEERTSDIHTSIDQVVDKLETQLKHYKERRVDRHRRPHRHGLLESGARHRATAPPEPVEAVTEDEESVIPDEDYPILRRKRFPVEMMAPEDAAERMQLLGHDFFVFLNSESRQVNVVYQRQDGGFGVLEPETPPAVS